jgi:MoaA/NifB/PqqE/SkfB family radical SAM enzyme
VSDLSPLAVTEPAAGTPSAHGSTATFCIRLWQHMRLDSSGEARVCCAYQGPTIQQDGVPMTTDRHSLMEIWNSDEMRRLRRDMVEGRRIGPCASCYTEEARGAVSLRMRDNTAWEQGWLNEERATIDEMVALAVDNDFRLPKLPVMIEVETGNLCNLRCRMCHSVNSSLIAKDPVQKAWESSPHAGNINPTFQRSGRTFRRVGPIESLVDELAKDTASRVMRLYFLGGEPFLVREIPVLVERLIATGRAQQISLLFVSNGSVMPEFLSRTRQFSRVDLSISVDGHAGNYEYIRYPGRWADLAHNLQQFKQLPNLHVQVTTTVQANNVLRLTDLFRYLDSVGIGFTGYLLHYPRYLAVGVLPSSIRRLAAARLTEYADGDCRPENRALVLSFAAQVDASDESGASDLLRDFMLFTNDLDASRGESIHRADPELVELLEQAGFQWPEETLHAPAASVSDEKHKWRLVLMEARNAKLKLQRELSATIKLLPDELSRSRDTTEPSVEHAAAIAGEVARVRFELSKVYDSRSWRLTRPLRTAQRMLPRWLQRKSPPGELD